MIKAIWELEEWIKAIKDTGYRGLALLHTASLGAAFSIVASRLSNHYSTVTCIAPKELREAATACSAKLSPSAIERLLGTDNDAAVMAIPGLLRPNLVAAAAETIRGSGVLVVIVPRLDDWRPGGEISTGNYKRYLVTRLYSARSVFWADLDTDTVYLQRIPSPHKTIAGPGVEDYRAKSHVHRELLRLALSMDQARALDELVYHFRARHGRGAFIVGDRGRGKSGLLGLFAAYLVASHMVGYLPVTAPSPWSVQSFFKVLLSSLKKLGIKRLKVAKQSELIITITGPWFRIRYMPPDRVEPGSFTIIDEGAAIGPLRLRLISQRAPRLLIATTIHGYEGSGRILAKIVENIVPEPRTRIELKTPIRYPPGDPLEEWIYQTFMLRAEPYEAPSQIDIDNVGLSVVQRDKLVEDYELLHKLYSILVLAHYRNEPDDLALILDAPHHVLFAASTNGRIIAVADVSLESGESPYEARIIPDLLATSNPKALGLKGLRIVRIAVHPELQRRGIGSKLLSFIESWASQKNLDWIGASFGQPEVIRFWLHNKYSVAYISPLPSRATGEHNIVVIKPLNNTSLPIINAITQDMLRRLLLAGHTLYRGVPAETLATIIGEGNVQAQPPLAELTPEQKHRINLVLSGQIDIESALDAYWLLLVNKTLENGGLGILSNDERIILVARIVQGKTMRDLIAITGKDAESIRRIMLTALKKLIENEATN